jgi:integrase
MEAGLAILTGQPKAIVAVFAFAALRPGEVASLKWEDYDGKTLSIDRAVWEGEVGTPKTRSSRASVPVVAPLRQVLDAYKANTAGVDWMFPGATGLPIRLSALAVRIVRPAFKKAGIKWKTWYGFRRGAGSYLLRLGLSRAEVRSILRHDLNSKVLERHYANLEAEQAEQKRAVITVGNKIELIVC